MLAIHFAGGGHNDAWPFALVLAALAVALSGRRELAGAGWALAALVKWVPLVLLPLRLVESRARRVGFGYLGLAGAAAVVLALGTWRYGLAWADARPIRVRSVPQQLPTRPAARAAGPGISRKSTAAKPALR